MAPSICVTSFRLLLRRTDLCILNRGLRLSSGLTPVAALTMNSWSLSRRGYCSDKPHTFTDDLNAGATASSTASAAATNSAAADLTQWKVKNLKAQLHALGLATTGKKEILIKRLQDYHHRQRNHGENSDNQRLSNYQQQQQQHLNHLHHQQQQKQPQNENQMQMQMQNFNLNEIHENHQQHTTTARHIDEQIPTTTMPIAIAIANTNAPSTRPLQQLNASAIAENVLVEYIQGIPHLTVPLPSRNEKCRFALKPISHKVGDLIDMLKTEDRGIDRATVLNDKGVRIASTCNIENLLDEPFWLLINDKNYKVVPPVRARINTEDLNKLGDVRAVVAQLYEALHVGEYQIQKSKELATKLEDLKFQIAPLEQKKDDLCSQAERKTSMLTWFGLGLMSVQFGILARLTWWEYSWDIMEPVTYFVTYGTTMAMYAYYCITRQEYNLRDVKDREYLLTVYKRAKKSNFDLFKYNELKRKIAEIEYDLRRLHDPLNMQLPQQINRSQELPPAVSSNSITSNSNNNLDLEKSKIRLPFFDTKK